MSRIHLERILDRERTLSHPALLALAIALVGVVTMLMVDFGPWSHPQLQTAEVANYRTTGEAARAAGATVVPTDPKPALEPEAPGPKPLQPASPALP